MGFLYLIFSNVIIFVLHYLKIVSYRNMQCTCITLLDICKAYIVLDCYTGCPRRKGQIFGRVFLMLKYTDITQNTYIQSWTVTEIMAREKCGLLAGLRTGPCQLTAFRMSVLDFRVRLQKYRWRGTSVLHYGWLCMSCIVLGTLKDNYDVSAGFLVVQFNGFMSLTS